MKAAFRRAHALTVVLFALNCTVTYASYHEENLTLRYSFNEGRGSAAIDHNGTGADATLVGDTAYVDNGLWSGKAKWGNAVALDGEGDFLTLRDTFHNNRIKSDAVCATAWILPAATQPATQYIVSKIDQFAGSGFALLLTDGRLQGIVYLNGYSEPVVVTSDTQIDSQWTHVALLFDGNRLQLFINGLPDSGSAVIPGQPLLRNADTQFTIGARSAANPDSEFQGLIDEVRLYSRQSAEGILELASAPGGEPGLVFYEAFDHASSTVMGTNQPATTNINDQDFVDGPFGKALNMQNSGDQGERLAWPLAGLLPEGKGHISFWYRPNYDSSTSGGRTLLETSDRGAGAGLRVYRWSSGEKREIRIRTHSNYLSSGSNAVNPAASWRAGEWHQVEFTWDLTSNKADERYMAYIVDGELTFVDTMGNVFKSGSIDKLFLGSSVSGNYMDGAIDELKIYAEPLNSYKARIQNLRRGTARDGIQQTYETVYNSADAPFPDAALAAADPVSFYQTATFERVYPGTMPSANELSETLTYHSARNDSESLFLNIYSQTDAHDVTVTLSNLVQDATGLTAVDAGEMQLRVVKNWWQRTAYDQGKPGKNPFHPVFVPELLMFDDRYNFKNDDYDTGPEADHSWDNLPSFPAPPTARVQTELKAFTSKQFVATLKLPASLEPGTYHTKATVSGAGLPGQRQVTLRIHVADIQLPVADKDINIYHRLQFHEGNAGNTGSYTRDSYAQATPGYFNSKRDYFKAELRDIREHGFNSIYSRGDRPEYVADIRDTGFHRKVFFPYKQIFPQGSPNQSLIDAMQSAYGEFRVYGKDEAGGAPTQSQANQEIEQLLSEIDVTKQHGGNPSTAIYLYFADCLTSPQRLRHNPSAGNQMMDFCQYTGEWLDPLSTRYVVDHEMAYENLNVYNTKVINGTKPVQDYFEGLLKGDIEKDPQEQSYYWQARSEDARINRYYAGVHLYLTDLAGIWPYAYIHNNSSDPFDDLDNAGAGRDMNVVYPTQQGPMSTIQWEAMREGIDDYRYLQAWQSLYEATHSIAPAMAAQSEQRLEFNETTGIGLHMFRHRLGVTLATVSHADFDAMRRQIAMEIELLQQGLADPDRDGLPTAYESANGDDPNNITSPLAEGMNLSARQDFGDPSIADQDRQIERGSTLYVAIWSNKIAFSKIRSRRTTVTIGDSAPTRLKCSAGVVCTAEVDSINLPPGTYTLNAQIKTKRRGGSYKAAYTVHVL